MMTVRRIIARTHMVAWAIIPAVIARPVLIVFGHSVILRLLGLHGVGQTGDLHRSKRRSRCCLAHKQGRHSNGNKHQGSRHSHSISFSSYNADTDAIESRHNKDSPRRVRSRFSMHTAKRVTHHRSRDEAGEYVASRRVESARSELAKVAAPECCRYDTGFCCRLSSAASASARIPRMRSASFASISDGSR